MTLVLLWYLPQAALLVHFGKLYYSKDSLWGSWLHSALTFSSPTTRMATPWYWANPETIPSLWTRTWKFQSLISTFCPSPSLRSSFTWNRYFTVIIRPWQVPQSVSSILILHLPQFTLEPEITSIPVFYSCIFTLPNKNLAHFPCFLNVQNV